MPFTDSSRSDAEAMPKLGVERVGQPWRTTRPGLYAPYAALATSCGIATEPTLAASKSDFADSLA